MAVGVNEFNVGELICYRNVSGETVTGTRRPYSVKLRVRIYVPFSQGAQKAYEMADWIHTVLFRQGYAYKVSEVEFDCAKYDSQTESITLDTFCTIKGELSGNG